MADIETLAATKRTHAEGAAPATPSAAEVVIYAKSDGLMYSKDDAGTETLMSSGTSLSNPMTTAEDIIKGGVSGATSRMALGASNTALASSNSALAYVPLGTKAFAPDSLGASSAPTAANDFTQGWRRGSRWIDTAADKEYVCLDETTGAAVWTETTGAGSGGAGTELDYVQITSAVSVTGASGSETTCITGTSQTYEAVPVIVEVFSPQVEPASSAGNGVIVQLWDGATRIGRLTTVLTPASGALRVPIFCRYFLTPTAGTHQYIVKAYKSGGNGSFGAGAGDGSDGNVPAYIRVITR